MPSDRQTRRQRHQASIKPQRGKAVRGAQATEFVKGAGFRKSEFVGGKKYPGGSRLWQDQGQAGWPRQNFHL